MRLFCASLLTLLTLPSLVLAQAELSVYGIANQPSESQVQGSDPGGAGAFDFSTDWSVPSASGIRLTYWQSDEVGFGVDVNTTGVTADPADLSGTGIEDLALERGTSILTINAFRRWESSSLGMAPYVGAGLGVSFPQIRFDGGGVTTDERQVAGPAMQIVAGARYSVGNNVSLFGEMQGAYSINRGDLQSGGALDTNILTNGVNFGITLGF